jgi:hypothetical protein
LITQQAAVKLLKAAKAHVRHYLNGVRRGSDSEAVADVVSHVVLFALKHWREDQENDIGRLVTWGFLHACRSNEAPWKRGLKFSKRKGKDRPKFTDADFDGSDVGLCSATPDYADSIDTASVLSRPEWTAAQRELIALTFSGRCLDWSDAARQLGVTHQAIKERLMCIEKKAALIDWRARDAKSIESR